MNPRNPNIILLDWDGTLADVVPISAAALNATLIHMGKEPLDESVVRNESGKPLPVLFPNQADQDFFIETHRRLSQENPPPPIDGADALVNYLNTLRTHGVFVGIISNKPRENIEREMKQFGWDGMFDVIVGSNDVSAGKPNPEPLAKALAKHQQPINPQKIIYIGDTSTDAAFAKNCGIKFIGVGDKITSPLQPEERCNDLRELLSRIKLLIPNRSGSDLPKH
jgi:phosphoglycolate phosphatase